MGIEIGVAWTSCAPKAFKYVKESTDIERDELLGRIYDFVFDVDVLSVLAAVGGIERVLVAVTGNRQNLILELAIFSVSSAILRLRSVFAGSLGATALPPFPVSHAVISAFANMELRCSGPFALKMPANFLTGEACIATKP